MSSISWPRVRRPRACSAGFVPPSHEVTSMSLSGSGAAAGGRQRSRWVEVAAIRMRGRVARSECAKEESSSRMRSLSQGGVAMSRDLMVVRALAAVAARAREKVWSAQPKAEDLP